MLNMVLHLKWLTNVFELRKLVHRKAPEVHFFLTPGVGRLSVQLRQHNKLLCLILEAGKKCCSGSLVWVNLNNSNESDLHSRWGTWFCMLEMRSSQRLMLLDITAAPVCVAAGYKDQVLWCRQDITVTNIIPAIVTCHLAKSDLVLRSRPETTGAGGLRARRQWDQSGMWRRKCWILQCHSQS